MKATHVGILNMPSLPAKAIIDVMFSTIEKSLLPILAMCDEGDESKFMKKEFYISHEDNVILKGKRDMSNGLWLVPIGLPEKSHNSVIKVTENTAKTS